MAVQCSVHARGTVGGLIPRVLGIQSGDCLLSSQCVQSDSLLVCWGLSHCTLGFPSCPISRSLARTSLGQCFYSPCLLPLIWPLIFLAPSISAAGLSSATLRGPYFVFRQRVGVKCYWNFLLIELLIPPSLNVCMSKLPLSFKGSGQKPLHFRKPSFPWILTVFCLYSYPGSAILAV